jgi:protein SCO1/2
MSKFLYLVLVLEFATGVASADTRAPSLRDVGFDQNLDAFVPRDLAFRDEMGRFVRLGDFLGKRPVILNLVYYRCPLLCGQELQGLARSLTPLSLSVGKEFDILTVSFDPREKPPLAVAKKEAYLKRYGRAGAESGWHFLTGDAGSIERLARTVGFRYTYNPRTGLYTHAAGLVVLTPGGKIARYFYGVDYSPKDLQFALTEASAGRIGSPIARLLLFCYDYDAATGKYTLAIVRLIRILGTATACALATLVYLLLRREQRGTATLPLSSEPATLC